MKNQQNNHNKGMNCAIYAFVVVLMIGILCGCTENRSKAGLVREERQIDRMEQIDYMEVYNSLDWKKLEEELFSISDIVLPKSDVLYDEECEDTNWNYYGTFPDELTKEFGSVLLQNSLLGMQEMAENTDYFEILQKYGSDKFQVENSDDCLSQFQYVMGEKEYILSVYDNGGSAGYCHAVLKEVAMDGFNVISSFELQNKGYGRVICYEEGKRLISGWIFIP